MRNRGELAEGWYDPATLQKAQASAAFNPPTIASQTLARDSPVQSSQSRGDESSEDDVVGPAIPDSKLSVYKASRKSGPAIPDFQDLELQRGKYPLVYLFIVICDLHRCAYQIR